MSNHIETITFDALPSSGSLIVLNGLTGADLYPTASLARNQAALNAGFGVNAWIMALVSGADWTNGITLTAGGVLAGQAQTPLAYDSSSLNKNAAVANGGWFNVSIIGAGMMYMSGARWPTGDLNGPGTTDSAPFDSATPDYALLATIMTAAETVEGSGITWSDAGVIVAGVAAGTHLMLASATGGVTAGGITGPGVGGGDQSVLSVLTGGNDTPPQVYADTVVTVTVTAAGSPTDAGGVVTVAKARFTDPGITNVLRPADGGPAGYQYDATVNNRIGTLHATGLIQDPPSLRPRPNEG